MRHSLSLQLFRLDLSGTPQLHLNIWVLKTGRARRSLAGGVVGAGSWGLLLHLMRCPWCPRVQGCVLLSAPLLLEKSRAADHGWRLSMAPECLSAAIPTEGCELPRAQPVNLGWGLHILGAHQLPPAHLWDCTTPVCLYSSTTYL